MLAKELRHDFSNLLLRSKFIFSYIKELDLQGVYSEKSISDMEENLKEISEKWSEIHESLIRSNEETLDIQ